MPGKYDTVVRRSRRKYTRRPAMTEEEATRAQALVDDGASLREAARTIGFSVGSLAYHRIGPGWTREQAREWRHIRKEAA